MLKVHTYNIAVLPSTKITETVEVLYPRLNDGKRDTRTKGKAEFKMYVKIAIPQYIEVADAVVLIHKASAEDVVSLIMKILK